MSQQINDVVFQMRHLAYQSGLEVEVPAAREEGINFAAALKYSLDQVNALQQESNQLATRFELGDPEVDLGEVMVAMQKSSLSFTALTQVRNKLLEAYQDIIKMPI